ncbi:MAG: serine/threonine-protein kinase [Gemmatimonadota bacterium]
MHAPEQLFLDLQQALIGEYSLERELGRGGMGVVYLARDVQLDRLVAIKVLPREPAGRDETRARFLREARTAAQLSHPNIVPIFRVGEAAGLPYFVMAYVDGETLGERLRRRGPVTASVMTAILREVAQALGYAHGRGVIHRDVKPDNILLDRESGRALVSDFGIAGRIDDHAGHSAPMGTAQFMSPEQLQGQPLDGRADLYALGVVAFLSLSGKLPFDGSTVTASKAQRVGYASPSLADVAPGLPTHLVRVVDTCLMQEVTRRWTNAEALVSALHPEPLARRELPEVLRDWARPTWLVNLAPLWIILPLYLQLASVPWAVAILVALPLIPIGVLRFRQSRDVLAAGHSLADLRLALRVRQFGRVDASGQPVIERRSDGVVRAVTLGLVVAAAMCMGLEYWRGDSTYVSVFDVRLPLTRATHNILENVGNWAFWFAAAGTVILGTLGVRVLPPRFERRTFGRLRERMWNGRMGAWLVARLTPKHRGVPSSHFRPTEIALAGAAEELFATLPAAYRASLATLPSVVTRLTARASTLREHVGELTKLSDDRGAEIRHPLMGSVDRARRELSETVTALECIRMDLLRLHGGLADLRPLTSTLDAARAIGDDIDRLQSAQREVALGTELPIDLRTPTPA